MVGENENGQDTNPPDDNSQEAKFQALLEQMQKGYKLTIYRVKPANRRGYLETLEINPADPIDYEYLASEWGGHELKIELKDRQGKIRGGMTVEMFNYPPKFRGVPMRTNEIDIAWHQQKEPGNVPGWPAVRDRELRESLSQIQTQQPAADVGSMFKEFVKLYSMTRKDDIGMMQNMFAGEKTMPTNPMEQMLEFARMQAELKKLLGVGEQAASAPEADSNLFGTISEIVKAMAGATRPPPQAQSRYLPPRAFRNHNPGVIRNDLPGHPAPPDLSGMLAGLAPDRAAEICMKAMSKMPEQKRSQVIAEFMSRLGDLNGVDCDGGEEVEDEDEDFEDYEPEELGPFTDPTER